MNYKFIFLTPFAFAISCNACILQQEFISSFTLEGKYLNIDIHRVDGRKFRYYTIEPVGEDVFVGFHFADKRKIDFRKEELKNFPIGSPGIVPDDEGRKLLTKEEIQAIRGFFYEPYNISFFMHYKKVSQIYYLPLKDYQEVSQYKSKIDLESFIGYNKVVLDANNIKGIQRIKFYVKFLHTQKPITCSYFESPTIEVDLDTVKPQRI